MSFCKNQIRFILVAAMFLLIFGAAPTEVKADADHYCWSTASNLVLEKLYKKYPSPAEAWEIIQKSPPKAMQLYDATYKKCMKEKWYKER